MILRHQLPTWSPVTFRALSAGFFPSKDALIRVEQRISREFEARSVRLTSSGTVALALGFLATARGRRPRIGLPAWGCYDLLTAADAANAEVFLYDVDPLRLAPDRESLSAALNHSLDAVVVAHWFGIPVDLEPVLLEARRANVLLIDDAAQGVGASMSGKPVGSQGDLGVLSFGRGKGRTGGTGGALLANSEQGEAVLDRAARLDDHASSSWLALWAQWLLGRPWLYGIPSSLPFLRLGETVYKPPPPMRSLPLRSASVLDRAWEDSLEEARLRSERAQQWLRILPNRADLARIEIGRGANPGWLRCPVLATGSFRGALMSNSAKKHGVVPGYPSPLNRLPVFPGRIVNFREEFEGAERLAHQLFTFPTHRFVGEKDFDFIEEFKK